MNKFVLTAAILSLVIAIGFTSSYASLELALEDKECIAFDYDEDMLAQTQIDILNAAKTCPSQQTMPMNVRECDAAVVSSWDSVASYGFGVWLTMVLCSFFAIVSAMHPLLTACNTFISCIGINIILIIHTILLAAYRFSWNGRYCAEEGRETYESGRMMRDLLIA